MKPKFLLVFGLVVLIFVAYGYLRAIPSENNLESSKGPRISVEPKVFDFGEVKFGQVVEHTFAVKNTGDETLKIRRVSTSCACTKAKIDKEKLGPGETAELLVTYNSGAMGKKIKGKKVERFIYLKSNDPINPQMEVTIYARVK